MRFAILSLVAAGALAVSAGTADAQWRGNNRGYSNFNRGYSNYSNYGNWNRGYSNWNRPYYGGGSGFGLTIGGSRGIISIGSGNVYPSYGGFYNPRPYYGGWNGYGRGYGSPWRW